MTKDGLNNLDIAYNYLNLPTVVSGGGGDVKVRYSYLADGTKIESVDDAGSGYAYIGSLVYRKSNAGYELESVPFSAGRIYATSSGSGTTYDVNYHLTDQVGSVRAVVNGVGEVQQQSDYYAFGLRHASTDFATNDNRYQLTGKESQKDFGFNYLDFHARQYDPTGIQFTSQDPLQDEYRGVSSYNYCLGNPLSYTDPTGLFPVETFFDIGMVVVGSLIAISEHISGDHDAALETWDGVALDVGAAIIPYAPAVGTLARIATKADKAVDGAKAIDKAADGAKVTR